MTREDRRAAFIQMLSGHKELETPRMAEPTYTDAQAAKLLEQLQCFAAARNYSQSKLAGVLNIASSSLSALFSGKYAGDGEGHLAKIEQFLDRETERAEKPSLKRFVETSVSKAIFSVLRQNHIHGTMGSVLGDAGVGKTRAFREYAARNENVIFLNASTWVRTPVGLSKTLARIVLTDRSSHNMQDRCEALVGKLEGASRLIIIDQAHQISEAGFEFLQNLWDQVNPSDDERRLGIVCGCTYRFWQAIEAPSKSYLFEQLTRRMNAGTNKKIGKAPFRMSDIDAVFCPENLKFVLNETGRNYLFRLANGRDGLSAAIDKLDHLQHALTKARAPATTQITAENLKQMEELMLRKAA